MTFPGQIYFPGFSMTFHDCGNPVQDAFLIIIIHYTYDSFRLILANITIYNNYLQLQVLLVLLLLIIIVSHVHHGNVIIKLHLL